ncbi:hypothetical protein RchiOBHm_Chr2g0095611 [Rosa chinensis]|uniref:Uncharacterized protein n=1 Tax=Rosa chinensis TaxID=74649 RepID=A0A2P6RKU1_ROSCH|nr:hypothetical protein RchiOBHm_Chr2g0095611 [Rosa chinensis]
MTQLPPQIYFLFHRADSIENKDGWFRSVNVFLQVLGSPFLWEVPPNFW